MKRTDLLEALGQLDAKYIREADARAAQTEDDTEITHHIAQEAPAKQPIYRILTGIAAVVLVGIVTAAGFAVIRRLERAQTGSSEAEPVGERNLLGGTGEIKALTNGVFADDAYWYPDGVTRAPKQPKQNDQVKSEPVAIEGEDLCTIPGCRHDTENCYQWRRAHLFSDGMQLYYYDDAAMQLYAADSKGSQSVYADLRQELGDQAAEGGITLDCIQRIADTGCCLISVQTADAFISYFRFDSGSTVFPEVLRCGKGDRLTDAAPRLNDFIVGTRMLGSGSYALESCGLRYDAESSTVEVGCTLIPTMISSFSPGPTRLYFRLDDGTAEEIRNPEDVPAVFSPRVALYTNRLYFTNGSDSYADWMPVFAERHIAEAVTCTADKIYFLEDGMLYAADADGKNLTAVCSAELIHDDSTPTCIVLCDLAAVGGAKTDVTADSPILNITRLFDTTTGSVVSISTRGGENGARAAMLARKQNADGVTVQINERSVCANGLTAVIHNAGYERGWTGAYCVVPERGSYSKDDFGDAPIPDRSALIPPETEQTVQLDWTDKYGDLANGKYRLVMEFWNFTRARAEYLEAKFTVDPTAFDVKAVLSVGNITAEGCTVTVTNTGKVDCIVQGKSVRVSDESGLFLSELKDTDADFTRLEPGKSDTFRVLWSELDIDELDIAIADIRTLSVPIFDTPAGQAIYISTAIRLK